MEPWIFVTLGAASAQTLRFMLQKRLASGTLTAAGATFARFVWSAPLVAVAAVLYGAASGQGLPVPEAGFWPYALIGGIAQILATICTVSLFKHRNFAVGITFKKTEVLLSALVGIVVLGEAISWGAFWAICLGLVGVLLLSRTPGLAQARFWNRATALGLASGLGFAISAVGYRGATLGLASGDALLRALVTLACVTAAQTLILGAWLLWRERGEVGRVLRSWRVSGLVGITSMIGSACWFTAFAMQTVALVKAVGQAELILSALVSVLVFGERITRTEGLGMIVLGASIVALVLVT
ncbi:DMT family transporter [Histidinibacterium aquaticum]|uniref:EamA/RhaT family transporter n=1 Tax=Histidinibacterium aquaticum TaxID=2613962 RepID=A0A5J5GD59_9RHOB|nr:DMT family transporter [Histidinibacterium aquaticum]KAA9005712.1 EamA/RhaT family transporter [Histidinibacterium aquaticum]